MLLIGVLASTGLVDCAKSNAKPLKCPSGTEVIGSGPPTGKREFCAKKKKKKKKKKVRKGQRELDYVKHGPWRSFWPNGKIESTRIYKNDKEHGDFRTFSLQGHKIIEGKYEKGVKVGVWRKYSKAGVISKETEYVGGLKHGFIKLYDDMGVLEQELIYRNGQWLSR